MPHLHPLALIVAVLMIASASADDAPRLTPGPDTTVFTEPVRDDGTIDYAAAINARGRGEVPAEHNAFVDLAKLMPLDAWQGEQRRRTFEALGVTVPPPETPYVSLDDFAAAREGKPVEHKPPHEALKDFAETVDVEDEQDEPAYTRPSFLKHFDAAMDAPWSRQEHLLIADWLEANTQTLERLEAASRRRGYFAPHTNDGPLFAQTMPELGFARVLSRMLTARAQLRIGEGDLGSAWRDGLTLKRLGLLMQQSGPPITGLVGMSIHELARDVIAVLLVDDALTHDQAARMIEDMAALTPPSSWLADTVDQTERWMVLDAVMRLVIQPQMAKAIPFEEPRLAPLVAAARGFDMDPLLRDINEQHDKIVDILRSEAPPQRKLQRLDERTVDPQNYFRLLHLLEARLEAEGAPMPQEMFNEQLRRLLKMLVRQVMPPSYEGFYATMLKHQLLHRVELTAMAAAAYRARHERYPEALGDLVPDYLPRIPRDVDSKPLRYNRDGDDDVAVYSIGDDFEDNGGDGEYDDLVLRLRNRAEPARPTR